MGWGTDPTQVLDAKFLDENCHNEQQGAQILRLPTKFIMASKCKIRFSTAAVYVYGSAGGDQKFQGLACPTPACRNWRHTGRYAHMSYTSLHTNGPVRHTRAASPSCTVPPAADGGMEPMPRHLLPVPHVIPSRHKVKTGCRASRCHPITIERLCSTRTR